jgi:hypothetical protein
MPEKVGPVAFSDVQIKMARASQNLIKLQTELASLFINLKRFLVLERWLLISDLSGATT